MAHRCIFCKKSYRRSDNLRRHINSAHCNKDGDNSEESDALSTTDAASSVGDEISPDDSVSNASVNHTDPNPSEDDASSVLTNDADSRRRKDDVSDVCASDGGDEEDEEFGGDNDIYATLLQIREDVTNLLQRTLKRKRTDLEAIEDLFEDPSE